MRELFHDLAQLLWPDDVTIQNQLVAALDDLRNADAGCGLIRYGSALVPFINRFPRDTKLYELMTTRPGEGVFGGEKEAM